MLSFLLKTPWLLGSGEESKDDLSFEDVLWLRSHTLSNAWGWWWARTDLNCRPADYESDALTN
jgi:hypothetical protein